MKETIERYPRLEDGDYVFTVVGVPEKVFTPSGKPMRNFTFNYNGEKTFKFRLFPQAYTPIVLVIGGVAVGGKVDWDDETVDGKTFSCTLKTVRSKDDKYENYVFENCKEEKISF